MFLPHRTAATTEAKVSSSNNTSDASFATAVPLRPIAKPTSAARSAAASFVPSPVTATTSGPRRRASERRAPTTSAYLSSGEARARTRSDGQSASNAA